MPYRARLLVPRARTKSLFGLEEEEGVATTRHDTVTGTPGSVVERRKLPPTPANPRSAPRYTNRSLFYSAALGSRYKINHSHTHAIIRDGVAASARRQRSLLGYYPKKNNHKLRPYVVDLVCENMFVPEQGRNFVGPVNGLQRFDRKVKPLVAVSRPSGLRTLAIGGTAITGDKVARFAHVNNSFTFFHEPIGSWVKAFNENCKLFGPIARDRHFRFVIKLVTFFGMSEKDFKTILRVRDLWIRGTRKYKSAVSGLIHSFPDMFRQHINGLSRKPKREAPSKPKGRRNPRIVRESGANSNRQAHASK